MSKTNKLAFLSMPAPASYVAGLGRGASGFTTRSDIGPAREGPSEEVVNEARARRGEEPDYDPDAVQDPENETGLFAGMVYDADDEEADRIYESVDTEMDKRRKARREARENEEQKAFRAERPKIQQQFADLKRGLSAVTDEEWENLPEVGNLTKRRKVREMRTYAVPDSILVGDRDKNALESSLDPRQQEFGGFETPADSGTLTNFVEIGQARDKVLSLKLDQISSGTSTSIDPKGYLTDLNSVVHKTEAEIGDIKRARMLFDSLIKSNPKHGPGWIAAACVEEHAGRLVTARKLIKAGCDNCPKSEDVWLEAARLHNTGDAKIILANAVQHVGQSVKIWLKAAVLEGDIKAKKRVLRKALEHIPNSVRLWKETVNLESSIVDARILLSRAVEVIPQSVDLWLALARIETPKNAKAVLNKARKAIPTSHEIWIAAGRLLEQEATAEFEAALEDPSQSDDAAKAALTKKLELVDQTIAAGLRELRKHQVSLTREQWLKEAEKCEAEGSPRTCEAIVKASMTVDVEEEDRYDVWVGDAEAAESRERITTARAVLAYALRVFPHKKDLWLRAAKVEQGHGTRESLIAILQRAVEHCPQVEELWLRWAKEKWNDGDVVGARVVLEKAFVANPESEAIWLAAVKLEAENGELGVARQLLDRARTVANTERIWMKSAVFERQHGDPKSALSLIATALKSFPKFPKLYMIQGQVHQDLGNYPAARASFSAGLKACPKEPALWILASRLEEADGKSIKARALLDKARVVNAGVDTLWAEAYALEERVGGAAQAKAVLSRGLQECRTSGLLWSMAIWAEPRPSRKARSADAIRACGNDPLLLCTVARLLWAEHKIEKAREWFKRAISEAASKDMDVGDVWGWWLKFEREHGTMEHQEEVIKRCVAAAPRHSPVWQSISKDPKNVGMDTRQILEMVVQALE